jgi:hypothetical protein
MHHFDAEAGAVPISKKFNLGDGQKISFWKDPWFEGIAFVDIVPDLFKACMLRKLSVIQALTNGNWLRHFNRNLPQAALTQFVDIHDRFSTSSCKVVPLTLSPDAGPQTEFIRQPLLTKCSSKAP